MSEKKIIVGVPRSGKSTAAAKLSGVVLGSDDFHKAGLSKSEQSEAAKRAIDSQPEVAEGVMMLYGVRRWLKENPRGKPADEVRFMDTPKVPLTPGQERMAEQVRRAWDGVAPELRRRGVRVVEE